MGSGILTVYKVNDFNGEISYFDSSNNPNAQSEAQNLLSQKRASLLVKEAVRFSICATFVDGNNTTWREVKDTDPEDTVCQVFDTLTGAYTQCINKTEAFALNEQKKQNFLASVLLDKVYELDVMPEEVQPTIEGVDPLPGA